ncbi:MAG: AAA family ATPase [Clostridiales bacterium]|nr:AAA family ATPase [Clostridiales bacterium]
MSIYEFKREDAERFAKEYGPARYRGRELVFERCPYCHGGSKDRGTFSINIDTGQFQCKRAKCKVEGNMITLARDLGFNLSEDVKRYFNLQNYNQRFKTFKDAHRITESKDEAVEYLKSRGISESVCRKYEITVRADNNKILVFPFKDSEGKLTFIKYRNTEPGARPKEWCEKNCMPILFGMNHCTEGGRLVVTEGQIDSLTLAECGIDNAVSVPIGMNGFTWVPHCWNWLHKFSEIVVFGDCENGQVSLAAEIRIKFPKITRVVRIEDYQGYKDANDLFRAKGKDAIVKAIEQSEFVTSTRLKEMSEVEAVNIEKQPCISTGVKELDRILTGGFHYGGVVILTGKRGDGKSTMASQFIADALGQGHNCMIYSGEMPNVFVKNWLDRQLIGKATLTNSEIDRCNAWYRGRLFVYDDTDLTDEDDETGALLEIIEESILQKNCELILLDNLMTAMEEGATTDEALYRKQSDFVGKIAKMARRLNVIILLIAHPRKTMTTNISNDDVSGSADVTNKASLVLTYSRVIHDKQEPDPTERKLEVIKNRLTGKLGEVYMYYSEESKRIVGPDQNFKRCYIEPKINGEIEINDEEMEIPFYANAD